MFALTILFAMLITCVLIFKNDVSEIKKPINRPRTSSDSRTNLSNTSGISGRKKSYD